MQLKSPSVLLLLSFATTLAGCAAKAPPPSGFLSDYSKLQKIDDSTARYVSPSLSNYKSFIVDPVELRFQRDADVLDASE